MGSSKSVFLCQHLDHIVQNRPIIVWFEIFRMPFGVQFLNCSIEFGDNGGVFCFLNFNGHDSLPDYRLSLLADSIFGKVIFRRLFMLNDQSVQIVFQLAVAWFAGCQAGLNFPGINASQRLIKSLGFFGGMS